tara:strand:- start:557 stop:1957 length:1401 start_codon:yes stop_codon:yes gene_type:complete
MALGENLAGLFTTNPVNKVNAQGQPLMGGSNTMDLLTRSAGALAGRDLRTGREKITQEMASIDPKDPQKMAKMYGAIIEFSEDPAEQMQAATALQSLGTAAQAKQQLASYKDSLASQVAVLGLPQEIQEQIQNAPTSSALDQISKLIGQEQIKNAEKRDSKKSVVALFQSAGVDEKNLRVKYGQDLSGMPSDPKVAQDIINNETRGGIETFLDPATGTSKTYSTIGDKIKIPERQEDGTTAYRWVSATESGLEKAPSAIRQLTGGKVFSEKLSTKRADIFIDKYDKAEEATRSLAFANQALQMIPYINAGTLGPLKTDFISLAKAMGAPDSVTASAAASQLYFSNRGRELAIFVKNFGSGNGITEKDVKMAGEITGAELANDPRALRKIIEDSITVANALRSDFAGEQDKLSKIEGIDLNALGSFQIGEPMDLGFDIEEFRDPQGQGQNTVDQYQAEADAAFPTGP